ncbi:MAG: hypothetical protein ABIO02_00405 [Patescibacteria group bacterium]
MNYQPSLIDWPSQPYMELILQDVNSPEFHYTSLHLQIATSNLSTTDDKFKKEVLNAGGNEYTIVAYHRESIDKQGEKRTPLKPEELAELSVHLSRSMISEDTRKKEMREKLLRFTIDIIHHSDHGEEIGMYYREGEGGFEPIDMDKELQRLQDILMEGRSPGQTRK